MKRTNPMHGHTQKIQNAIAKDPLYRKNQQTTCIQDPTHIFSFPLLTNYLVEPQCMADENHGCCASLVKTLALSHASNNSSRVRPLSFMSSMILASDSGFESSSVSNWLYISKTCTQFFELFTATTMARFAPAIEELSPPSMFAAFVSWL